MLEALPCPKCGCPVQLSHVYCPECGVSLKKWPLRDSTCADMVKQASELSGSANEIVRRSLFPTAESFLEDCSLALEDYKIKTSIRDEKLILEKEAAITSDDRALFRAYKKKQAKIAVAEKEFNRTYRKYAAKTKDDSFYAIICICEIRNNPRLDINADFDDHQLVLRFPTKKDAEKAILESK